MVELRTAPGLRLPWREFQQVVTGARNVHFNRAIRPIDDVVYATFVGLQKPLLRIGDPPEAFLVLCSWERLEIGLAK
jgi:hypothetical protein